jgi:DNA-binding Lrp family transcriptional regulator
MVKLITEIGPRIPEIARRLQRHKETVRYWYKELMKSGFLVQASVNHESLGLRRVVLVVDFADEFKQYSDAILAAMHELCYIHSYAKTLPEATYIINASVPKELTNQWVELMRTLKERGLFTKVDSYTFDWNRNIPMRAEHYDFDHSRWDFDWTNRLSHDGTEILEPQGEQDFDGLDLGIIEHLEVDATSSLTEIQESLKVNYKTLNWHYRNHIAKRHLIRGYRINWAGNYYDTQSERPMHKQHKYAWIELLVRDVTEKEKLDLMSKTSELPFAWLESRGRNYHVQFAFPIEMMTEAMQFVEEMIAPVRTRTKWFLLDQTNALRFTINPRLYDEQTKGWKFPQPELIERFDKLIVHVKNGNV